ncbi:hypothetical protein AB0I22_33665 [Streptomyces sp. NPDC050610]|uniref:hypothetical protein n=1 Tax=Streptomyces sp. NPDC050610 TaxID=3157097 RepID=UPI0034201D62
MRIETVQEDQRQVRVLTMPGHGEAKQLLEPKGVRVSVLRKQEYDPDTGQLLDTGYDDHPAAVTSMAAEPHGVGIGHRLGSSYVQRADLVARAPAAGVPVLLLEIDRRTEDAYELVHKLRRYWEWGRLLSKHADKRTAGWPAPGRTRSSTSTTGSGCGAGSTRRPAEKACLWWRSCSRTPPRRRSPVAVPPTLPSVRSPSAPSG